MALGKKDWCVLNTDGGSRGNPGPAGSGFVLTDPNGLAISSGGRFLGVATNNAAEYDALVWGLQVAKTRGCRAVEVRMDSELIVRQMTGEYRVKNKGLKQLFANALSLVQDFEAVRFVHVPREDNTKADRLANEAMDARSTVGDAGAASDVPATQDRLF